MESNISVCVYGDSLLKATVPDAAWRYRFQLQRFLPRFAALPITLTNRARFGATVEKGAQLLQADLQHGLQPRLALLEFGGNDCNYNWAAIAADPTGTHPPVTPPAVFADRLRGMTLRLQAAGVTPVLMTLPPIHSQRYFDFFSRGLDREHLLVWLDGDIERIYRWQELYSAAVRQVAADTGAFCLDVRSRFLACPNLPHMIAADGIHLNEAGYTLLFDALHDALCRWLAQQPAA